MDQLLHYTLQFRVLLLELADPPFQGFGEVTSGQFQEIREPVEFQAGGEEGLLCEEVYGLAEMCSEVGCILFVALDAALVLIEQLRDGGRVTAGRFFKSEEPPADLTGLWRMRQLTLHIYLLLQRLQVQHDLLLFLLLGHYQLIDLLHYYSAITNPFLHDHNGQVSKQVCYAGVVIVYVIFGGVGGEFFADVDIGVHVFEGGMVEVYDFALGFAAEGSVSMLSKGVELIGHVDYALAALPGVLLPFVHQLPDQGSGLTRLHLLDLLLQRLNLPLPILQQSLEISNLTKQLLILLLQQFDHIRCLLQSLILQLTLSYQFLNRYFIHILTSLLLFLQFLSQFYLVNTGTNAALVLLRLRCAVGLEVGWG